MHSGAPVSEINSSDARSSILTKHPREWTISEVAEWLRKETTEGAVAQKFIENEIDGIVLLDYLTYEIVHRDLGVVVGKALRIIKAIEGLRERWMDQPTVNASSESKPQSRPLQQSALPVPSPPPESALSSHSGNGRHGHSAADVPAETPEPADQDHCTDTETKAATSDKLLLLPPSAPDGPSPTNVVTQEARGPDVAKLRPKKRAVLVQVTDPAQWSGNIATPCIASIPKEPPPDMDAREAIKVLHQEFKSFDRRRKRSKHVLLRNHQLYKKLDASKKIPKAIPPTPRPDLYKRLVNPSAAWVSEMSACDDTFYFHRPSNCRPFAPHSKRNRKFDQAGWVQRQKRTVLFQKWTRWLNRCTDHYLYDYSSENPNSDDFPEYVKAAEEYVKARKHSHSGNSRNRNGDDDDDDDDKVLPVYGESGDEYLSEGFVRELEQEKKEQEILRAKRIEKEKDRDELIERIFHNTVAECKVRWDKECKQKYEDRRYQLYRREWRRRNLLQKNYDYLANTRLKNMRKAICDSGASDEATISRQCQAVQPTVYEMCYIQWLQKLLSGPKPQKPEKNTSAGRKPADVHLQQGQSKARLYSSGPTKEDLDFIDDSYADVDMDECDQLSDIYNEREGEGMNGSSQASRVSDVSASAEEATSKPQESTSGDRAIERGLSEKARPAALKDSHSAKRSAKDTAGFTSSDCAEMPPRKQAKTEKPSPSPPPPLAHPGRPSASDVIDISSESESDNVLDLFTIQGKGSAGYMMYSKWETDQLYWELTRTLRTMCVVNYTTDRPTYFERFKADNKLRPEDACMIWGDFMEWMRENRGGVVERLVGSKNKPWVAVPVGIRYSLFKSFHNDQQQDPGIILMGLRDDDELGIPLRLSAAGSGLESEDDIPLISQLFPSTKQTGDAHDELELAKRPRGRKDIRPIRVEDPNVQALREEQSRMEERLQKRLFMAKAPVQRSKDINRTATNINGNDRDTSSIDALIIASGRVPYQPAFDTSSAEGLIPVNPGDEGKPIYIPRFIGNILKQHQIEGIQFMWKHIVMFAKSGGAEHGCVLAHSMGLGKTLQVIAFIYTLMSEVTKKNSAIPASFKSKRVLVICPATIQSNWCDEFRLWFRDHVKEASRVFPQVYNFSKAKRTMPHRLALLQQWFEYGGVMVMSYQAFRSLADYAPSGCSAASSTNVSSQILKYLIDPGPCLVIADEGHNIKNAKARLSMTASSIRTHSRICLTGYPLQNNLEEYWTMVDFVFPNYLGSLPDFRNAFINPIDNGLYADSTSIDRRISAIRLKCLHELLSSIVLRRDADTLHKELPRKVEIVISCPLSKMQLNLYYAFIIAIFGNRGMLSNEQIFTKSHTLLSLCNHPAVFRKLLEMRRQRAMPDTGGLADQALQASGDIPRTSADVVEIVDEDEPVADQDTLGEALSRLPDPSGSDDSWGWNVLKSFEDQGLDIVAPEHSSKLVITLEIIKSSVEAGEKVLLFTRSIIALDFLEEVVHRAGAAVPPAGRRGHVHVARPHRHGRYPYILRLDGMTPVTARQDMINDFNHPQSDISLFLISSRTGSLGINLVAASRVIIFDVGWNPLYDEQAIARAYRYGQKRRVYVYRLMTSSTWEEKLFQNNVHKVGLFKRVVDKRSLERHFTKDNMRRYFEPPPPSEPTINPEMAHAIAKEYEDDFILQKLAASHLSRITKIAAHATLLMDSDEIMDKEALEDARNMINLERLRLKHGAPSLALSTASPTQPQVFSSASTSQRQSQLAQNGADPQQGAPAWPREDIDRLEGSVAARPRTTLMPTQFLPTFVGNGPSSSPSLSKLPSMLAPAAAAAAAATAATSTPEATMQQSVALAPPATSQVPPPPHIPSAPKSDTTLPITSVTHLSPIQAPVPTAPRQTVTAPAPASVQKPMSQPASRTQQQQEQTPSRLVTETASVSRAPSQSIVTATNKPPSLSAFCTIRDATENSPSAAPSSAMMVGMRQGQLQLSDSQSVDAASLPLAYGLDTQKESTTLPNTRDKAPAALSPSAATKSTPASQQHTKQAHRPKAKSASSLSRRHQAPDSSHTGSGRDKSRAQPKKRQKSSDHRHNSKRKQDDRPQDHQNSSAAPSPRKKPIFSISRGNAENSATSQPQYSPRKKKSGKGSRTYADSRSSTPSNSSRASSRKAYQERTRHRKSDRPAEGQHGRTHVKPLPEHKNNQLMSNPGPQTQPPMSGNQQQQQPKRATGDTHGQKAATPATGFAAVSTSSHNLPSSTTGSGGRPIAIPLGRPNIGNFLVNHPSRGPTAYK